MGVQVRGVAVAAAEYDVELLFGALWLVITVGASHTYKYVCTSVA